MQATPQRDTLIERMLRTALRGLGLRYRIHRHIIPGLRRTGDVVFGRARVVVFVDGCFWHGCPIHGTLPKVTNRHWWVEKIAQNRRRDRDTDRRLSDLGWQVVRVWEHDAPVPAARRIARLVEKRTRALHRSSRK